MKVMNGHILSGTSVCVDYWWWTPEKRYHRFLTHLHADHTVNLKSSFCEKIYTSPFNVWLLRRWFNINPDCLVSLNVGDSHIMFDIETQVPFSVTVLDANHCPGSVMFLFQGKFGSILYTGDFRYNPSILEQPMLKSVIENRAVDTLYLDNTFAAEHCEFPPRQVVLKDIINLIKDHPDHNILLGVRKLGKEEVLRAVALELEEKVCVSEEKLRILTKLGYEKVFTTDPEESRIIVKEMPHITASRIDQMRAERGPVMVILLTALYSVIPPNVSHTSALASKDRSIHMIPYSDHSCHSELVEFVSKIKPKVIHPVVSCSEEKKIPVRQNDELSELLSTSWQNSVIPQSILKFSRNHESGEEVVYEVPVSNDTSLSNNEKNVVSNVSENKAKTNQESSKIVLKRNKSPRAGKLEDGERQEILWVSQQSRQSDKNSARLTNFSSVLSDNEYFSLSDEDLSQLDVITNKSNLPSTGNIQEKTDERDIMHTADAISEDIGDLQSQNLSPDSSRSLEAHRIREKLANFIFSTPELTSKSEKSKSSKIDDSSVILKDKIPGTLPNRTHGISESKGDLRSENLSPDTSDSENSPKACKREKLVNFIFSTPELTSKSEKSKSSKIDDSSVILKDKIPGTLPNRTHGISESKGDLRSENLSPDTSDSENSPKACKREKLVNFIFSTPELTSKSEKSKSSKIDDSSVILKDKIPGTLPNRTHGISESKGDLRSENLSPDTSDSENSPKACKREKLVNFIFSTPELTNKSKTEIKCIPTSMPKTKCENDIKESDDIEKEENTSCFSNTPPTPMPRNNTPRKIGVQKPVGTKIRRQNSTTFEKVQTLFPDNKPLFSEDFFKIKSSKNDDSAAILKDKISGTMSTRTQLDAENDSVDDEYYNIYRCSEEEFPTIMARKTFRKEIEESLSIDSDNTNCSSDPSVSILFESLDKKNYQICENIKSNTTDSKPMRISEKFNHFLAERYKHSVVKDQHNALSERESFQKNFGLNEANSPSTSNIQRTNIEKDQIVILKSSNKHNSDLQSKTLSPDFASNYDSPEGPCGVDKCVQFTFNTPLMTNKSKLSKKHCSTPMPKTKYLCTNDADETINSEVQEYGVREYNVTLGSEVPRIMKKPKCIKKTDDELPQDSENGSIEHNASLSVSLESLHRMNYHACKHSTNNGTNSKTSNIAKKVNRTLTTGFRPMFLGSDICSAPSTTNHKKSSSGISSVQDEEDLRNDKETNQPGSCKRKHISSVEINYNVSQRENDCHCKKSRNVSEIFCQNLNVAYKSWKKATEELKCSRSQLSGNQVQQRTDQLNTSDCPHNWDRLNCSQVFSSLQKYNK